MAAEGTKFAIIFRDTDTGVSKTINIANCQDSITAAQVNTFREEYNGAYGTSYALGTCYYEDVTHRGLGTNG